MSNDPAHANTSNDSNDLGNDILIEIIYPTPKEQNILSLKVSNNCNVEQAIKQSDILELYPEIDLTINKLGIFGKVCKLSDVLREGDRIEIYRPLIIDPKEARKNRALKQK